MNKTDKRTQVVVWHPSPQQAQPSGATRSPRAVQPAPSRLTRSLHRPIEWLRKKLQPEPRNTSFDAVFGTDISSTIGQYLGQGAEGDRAGWRHAALTGRAPSSGVPELPLGESKVPPGADFLLPVSDPASRAGLGQLVFLKDTQNNSSAGRSLGWGQEPERPTSWTAPLGRSAPYRPVEVSIAIRGQGPLDVSPDLLRRWDDGVTMEVRLGGRHADGAVFRSQGTGRARKPVRLSEAQLLDGVARHRSVLVKLSPQSAPTMVVLQGRQSNGDWIVRRPTSDGGRAKTGRVWDVLQLPPDTVLWTNPYDNVDRAEHPNRWHLAEPGDTLFVGGYAVECVRVHKPHSRGALPERLDVFCPASQGDDAHTRLAQRAKAVAKVPADGPAGKEATPGCIYTLEIPVRTGVRLVRD